ncbi:MAG: hypothetical protein IME96_02290 [Proteobacteria bacterium]|nr:hypothetical protein [Pseudomonadota bacterium]
MNKFEVCIRGQNFLIKTDNKVKKNGFYAARSIEARDMSSAVDLAMDSFRAELGNSVRNDKSDPPVLNVVEVNEVYYFQENMIVENMVVPTTGFLWDKEDESKPVRSWKWSIGQGIGEKDFHIHSMLLHFTNALYPVAMLFMFLFLIFRKDSFQQTYFYLMVLATLSAPVSYLSGIFEWKKRYQGAMVAIFLVKVKYGLVIFFIGGCCTLWYYLNPGVLEGGILLTVAFVILNLTILPPLIYLGHLGGIIVYEDMEKV